jgi:phosphonate transport system substrate-binding protein
MSGVLKIPALLPPRLTVCRSVMLVFALLDALCAVAGAPENAAPVPEAIPIHFAFSKSLFTEVNESDAKAAVKVYTQILAEENGMDNAGGALILDGRDILAEALRLDQVDVISLTTEEFLTLEDEGLVGPLLLTSIKKSFTEEYVLLVREASSLRKVQDLRGRNLIISSDIRASLGQIWLEVLCQQHGLRPAGGALKRVTRASKATQVVLPVFFGTADACVTTRSSWEVMGEMNPQVRKLLRVLAVSPPLVPAMTCFRRGFSEYQRQRIIDAAEACFAKPSFQQLMGLFKTDSMCAQPISVLESARELLATHRRLGSSTNSLAARLPGSDPVQKGGGQ